MREDPKFGTDGVRGLANADLSAFFAFRLGRTAGHVISGGDRGRLLVVGRDTRVSGDLLEAALVAGLLSVGVNVVDSIWFAPFVSTPASRSPAFSGVVRNDTDDVPVYPTVLSGPFLSYRVWGANETRDVVNRSAFCAFK